MGFTGEETPHPASRNFFVLLVQIAPFPSAHGIYSRPTHVSEVEDVLSQSPMYASSVAS